MADSYRLLWTAFCRRLETGTFHSEICWKSVRGRALEFAFLGVATFLKPIQIGSGATTSSRVPIQFVQVWRDQF